MLPILFTKRRLFLSCLRKTKKQLQINCYQKLSLYHFFLVLCNVILYFSKVHVIVILLISFENESNGNCNGKSFNSIEIQCNCNCHSMYYISK